MGILSRIGLHEANFGVTDSPEAVARAAGVANADWVTILRNEESRHINRS
jgi:hypothetical protein